MDKPFTKENTHLRKSSSTPSDPVMTGTLYREDPENDSDIERQLRTLKNFGRAGDSFNDIITDLVQKRLNEIEEIQSDSRPLNHVQTVAGPSALGQIND